MRITPAQGGMTALLGGFVPRLSTGDLKTDIRRGRELLVQVAGIDFGYDPQAWHEHLRSTDAGGYRWSNQHLSFPRRIADAIANPEWQAAVASLRSRQDAEPCATADPTCVG
jgi:hypothetical protein